MPGHFYSLDKANKANEPALLIDVLEKGHKQILKRVGVEITKPSYYKYRRSLKYMQEFLMKEYKVKNYTLNRIDVKFLEAFFHFLRTGKAISHNTALKYVTLVKSVLQPAIRSGVIKDDPFRELRIKPKPVHSNYLTQDEIIKEPGSKKAFYRCHSTGIVFK